MQTFFTQTRWPSSAAPSPCISVYLSHPIKLCGFGGYPSQTLNGHTRSFAQIVYLSCVWSEFESKCSCVCIRSLPRCLGAERGSLPGGDVDESINFTCSSVGSPLLCSPGRRQIVSAVNSSKFVVPEGYWQQYKRARVTFRHHIIYNPQTEVDDL